MKIINYKSVLSLSNGLKIFLCFLFLSFFFVHKSYAAVLSRAPNNLGLVAFWPMNEGGGTKAGDFSGNGNTATLTNSPSWASGKKGKALSFDGGSTALRPASDPIGTSTVTVCAWAKPFTTGDGGFGHILGNGKFEFFLSGGGTYWALNSDGGYGAFTTTAANTIKLNTWQHICAVRLSNGNGTMYYNGSQSGTPDVTGTPAAGTGLTIGEANLVGDYGFNGVIDDVRIYSRALSAAEILALYKSGLVAINSSQSSRLTDGLVGFWPFNGGDVTDKVYDRSGQNNHGGFYGGATSTAKTIGKLGQGLQFDGSNDYVNLGRLSATENASQLTWSFWAYPKSLIDNSMFLSKFDQGNTGNWGFSMHTNNSCVSGNQFGIYLPSTDGGTDGVVCGASGSVAANVWTHYVIVFDGTQTGNSNRLKAYMNGAPLSLDYSLAGTIPAATVTTAQNATIGSSPQPTHYFNGIIDEVRIYNRALSAPEVLQLYNLGGDKINSAQTSRLTSGLVGFWPFNGGDVTDKVYDRSGQNNNGGFYGGATSTAKTIGKLGQAFKFDGVDDYVFVNSNPLGSGAFTFSGWFYLRSGTNRTLFSVVTAGNANVGACEIIFNSKLACDNEGFSGSYAESSDAFPLNQWVYVTAVRKSNGTSMTLYFNGVRQGTEDQTVDPAASGSGAQFYIGSIKGSSEYWDGYIDEARVYNRALSVSEIQQLYNMGR